MTEGDIHDAYTAQTRQRGGSTSASAAHAWNITRAIAAGAARAGWTRSQFAHVALEGPYKGLEHARALMRRRGHDRAVSWLHRAYDGAAAHVAATDPITARSDFHAALAALRARIEVSPWPGVAGKTDMKNLLARLDICAEAGAWDHTVSERDLAERMGCSREAVRRSNRRLKNDHHRLRQLDSGDHANGARWMLITKPLSHDETTQDPPSLRPLGGGLVVRKPQAEPNIDSRTAARLMPADAFAHLGLSGSGLTLVSALAERDGQTIQELQGTASVSQATAYRRITQLKKLGYVAQAGELYHLTPAALDGTGEATEECTEPAATWDEAAERLGTAGTAQRRRERHTSQRLHWQHMQERMTERRRPAEPAPDPRRADFGLITPTGEVVDPTTGEVLAGWRVDSAGEWLWVGE